MVMEKEKGSKQEHKHDKPHERHEQKGNPQIEADRREAVVHRDMASRDNESLDADMRERDRKAAEQGTVTGKPAGTIDQHAPTYGGIVGEVQKPREALQEPPEHRKVPSQPQPLPKTE